MRPPGGPEERRRYLPIPHSELAYYATKSPIPENIREAKIFEFDTLKYPFKEAIADILEVAPEDLANIHETAEGKVAFEEELAGSNRRKRGKLPHFLKLWTSSGKTTARKLFNEILHKFMVEFVSMHMGIDGIYSEVAYQREPTFRVVMPSGQDYGYKHCDADYHHPPSEINWWLPVTDVSGSNTLHIESEPGKGDFAPVEISYGQVLRFYGNLCQHFAVPNVSGRCRVSFDTRVLSLGHHDPGWEDRLGRPALFQVGAYYTKAVNEDLEKDRTAENTSEEDVDCSELFR